MVEMNIVYEGQLSCKATHGPSGMTITTDAPKDNMGRGLAFSPTDLVGAALGSCMLTTMGIFAQRHNIEMAGARAHVTKEMVASPFRRIAKLAVTITMPKSLSAEQRTALENAANTCPVHKSLHPDVRQDVTFRYE